jgi:ornithine cyclodeaminase
MERAFLQLARNEAVLPVRTGVPVAPEEGLMLTMPGYLSADATLGLKVVSVFPKNVSRNRPSVNGVILLLDAATGEPQALMDAGWLTALRTGAVSGLATQYAAREDASHVAIIGSGAQAHAQLEAVAAVRNITRVSIWSRTLGNAQALAKLCAHRFDTRVCETPGLAVREADVICTVTASTEPLVFLQDLKPDAHINAIGSHTPDMREIDSAVLAKAVVLVDEKAATFREAGEVIHALNHGILTQESLLEIGQWLQDGAPDCRNTLSVFKSVGLAIQDLCVARVVYQNACARGLGQVLSS